MKQYVVTTKKGELRIKADRMLDRSGMHGSTFHFFKGDTLVARVNEPILRWRIEREERQSD